tara:strand:+ start:1725 stop:2276 length:552 start_codon:yes stop_codon:yes gene_type:complete
MSDIKDNDIYDIKKLKYNEDIAFLRKKHEEKFKKQREMEKAILDKREKKIKDRIYIEATRHIYSMFSLMTITNIVILLNFGLKSLIFTIPISLILTMMIEWETKRQSYEIYQRLKREMFIYNFIKSLRKFLNTNCKLYNKKKYLICLSIVFSYYSIAISIIFIILVLLISTELREIYFYLLSN